MRTFGFERPVATAIPPPLYDPVGYSPDTDQLLRGAPQDSGDGGLGINLAAATAYANQPAARHARDFGSADPAARATGAVPNYTILGGLLHTIYLVDPLLQNPFTVASGVVVSPLLGDAVESILDFYWTVTNLGTLTSAHATGIDFGGAGGLITNGSNGVISGYDAGIASVGRLTLANYGNISAASKETGVSAAAGTIVNKGFITGGFGVDISGSGNIVNSGTISGALGAAFLNAGTLANYGDLIGTGNASAALEVGLGSSTAASPTSILNLGTIDGAYAAVELEGGAGALSNFGMIAGGVHVAGASAAHTVSNFGTITGAPGVVASTTDQTVVNGGIIIGTGGTAVLLAGGDDRLVVDPGAAFQGQVNGGGGQSVLELAGVSGASQQSDALLGRAAPSEGTLAGIGSSVVNFATLYVAVGAAWEASGNASGYDFINDGTIIVANDIVASGETLVFGALSENAGDSGVIQLGGDGRAEFSGSVEAGQTVTFGSAGTLKIDDPAGFAGAITGFSAGDTIDLAGIVANTATLAGGVLTLGNGIATVARLALSTPIVQPVFSFASDGSGGTAITVAAATPPPAPANLALAPGSDSSHGDDVTNILQPTMTGTGQAGDMVTLWDAGAAIGTGTVGTGGNWTITTSVLGNGPQNITATETNLSTGLVSPASASLGITIETSAAAPGNLALTPGSDSSHGHDVTNVVQPTVTGTGEAGDTVTLFDNGAAIGSGIVGSNGNWTVTAGTTLPDGVQTITATETDIAGNTSTPSPALTVTIETSAPPPSAPRLATGGVLSGTPTPTFVGTGEAGDTVTLYDGSTAVGTGTVNQSGSWTITASPLATGSNVMTATETDVAGNVSAASPSLTITIQGSAPAPPALQLQGGGTVTADPTPTFVGTGAAGDTVTLYDGSTAVGAGTVNQSGSWTITADPLPNGSNVMTATETDAAGNVSAASPGLTITVQSSVPAPSAPQLQGGGTLTADPTPSFAGTGAAGDTVTLYDDGTAVGTGTVNAGGSWTIAASPLPNGANVLTATETDGSGNSSGASAGLDLTVLGPILSGSYGTTIPLLYQGTQNSTTITATGVIAATGGDGIYGAGYAWTLTNFGTVTGSGDGVRLTAGGVVANYGAISGGDCGVCVAGNGATVTNAGVISGGGTALLLAGYDDRLIVDPGAAFNGSVTGAGDTVLELAAGGYGSLSGLGTYITGFSVIDIDASADWALSGDASASTLVNDGTLFITNGDLLVIGSVSGHGAIDIGLGGVAEFTSGAPKDQTILFLDGTGTLDIESPQGFSARIEGFQDGDVIDLVGIADRRLHYTYAKGTLTLREAGNTVATLSFAGHYTSADFQLSNDGNGGTLISLAAPDALGASRADLLSPFASAAEQFWLLKAT
jgi:hypothetical protein